MDIDWLGLCIPLGGCQCAGFYGLNYTSTRESVVLSKVWGLLQNKNVFWEMQILSFCCHDKYINQGHFGKKKLLVTFCSRGIRIHCSRAGMAARGCHDSRSRKYKDRQEAESKQEEGWEYKKLTPMPSDIFPLMVPPPKKSTTAPRTRPSRDQVVKYHSL